MHWEGAGEAEAAAGRRMKCHSLRAFLVTLTSSPPFDCANLEITFYTSFIEPFPAFPSRSTTMKLINTNRFLIRLTLVFLLISTVSSIPSESFCRLPGRRCVKDDDCCPIPFFGKVGPMLQLRSFPPF